MMKSCAECSSRFHPDSSNRILCSDNCRINRRNRKHREYNEAHRDEIRERARAKRAADPEGEREKANARNARRADEIRERSRSYYKRERRFALQMRKYGITREKAERLLAQTTCEICDRERPLATDHDHKTGKVRGRLCHQCNTALGKLDDDPELLKKALSYLESSLRTGH